MKFEIGRPDHGWVAVCIQIDGQSIEFDASDVPNDPVACLVRAISDRAKGRVAQSRRTGRVSWSTPSYTPIGSRSCVTRQRWAEFATATG